MANIELPKHLLGLLGPEMKMDTHWIDVLLRDGRIFRRVIVEGGRTITGKGVAVIDYGPLPFETDDILDIRPMSLIPPFRWWFRCQTQDKRRR